MHSKTIPTSHPPTANKGKPGKTNPGTKATINHREAVNNQTLPTIPWETRLAQNPPQPNAPRRNAPLHTNQPCTLYGVYGHYTFECPFMGRAKQAIRNEVQHATNTTDQAQTNPTPQGPPPMVLQNPLPVQGLVATTPPPQPNPNAPGAPPITETGVHHLLTMTTEEVNLQTR